VTRNQVAIVGLGYVGLPLALAFGRELPTLGFDISAHKIAAYAQGRDPTGEMGGEHFAHAEHLSFSSDPKALATAEFIIVSVPTPVDAAHQPDLGPLRAAAQTVGEHMSTGATVIFESTVYPGVTEEVCAQILERASGLRCGADFTLGYSPERLNPGDTSHTLENIVKVVAGQDEATLDAVATLYQRIIKAGVHRAPSIKVAEAAKVIENTQRDINIALMNELAIIFDKAGIDTADVLAAAATKWNFLPFKPGLVGGHCIGVDPYYLTYKAELLGHHPEVIQAGRRINDSMGEFIASQTIKQIIAAGGPVNGGTVLVLGLTFKENCADLRNSRVIDVIRELRQYGVTVRVFDPVADPEQAQRQYGVTLCDLKGTTGVAAIVAAVTHDAIVALDPATLAKAALPGAAFIDVKSAFDRERLRAAGFRVWRL